MRIKKIDHVGVAIRDLDSMRPLFRILFCGMNPHCEEVEDQGVKATCFRVGETSIEFLESTRENGPIGKYLAKKGSGIHHLAVHVEGIEEALAELKEAGIPLVDETPRLGAEGKKIAFLHPKGTGGILIELCEGGTGAEAPKKQP